VGGASVLNKREKLILENDCDPTKSSNPVSNKKPLEALFRDDKHCTPAITSHQESGFEEKKHPLEWVIAFMLFGTLVATSIAACYTKKQWETAADQEQKSLRAYIIISDFGVFCPDCGDKTLTSASPVTYANSIRSRFENNGLTPATKVAGITNLWPVRGINSKLPSDFAFPDHEQNGFVSVSDIGKDKHKEAVEEIGPRELSMFRDAIASKTTLYIYGHIDYCDVFDQPHSTAFCIIYMKDAGTALPLCDRYNGEIHPNHSC
jgi:hypothetical protein